MSAVASPLPVSPEQLTPAWLTAALRESGTLPEGEVAAVEQAVIGTGVGFIGIVTRLTLTYSGAPADAPRTLIAKLPSSDPGSRMVGVAFGLYEREVRFYETLANTCGVPAPKPFYAAYDATAGQAVLLLEDLQGGTFGDQVVGATAAQRNSHRRHCQFTRAVESPELATTRGSPPREPSATLQPCTNLCRPRWTLRAPLPGGDSHADPGLRAAHDGRAGPDDAIS